MATKPTTKKQSNKPKTPAELTEEKKKRLKLRRKRVSYGIIFSCLFSILIYAYHPTFLILAVGLAPTAIFYFCDISPKKSLTRTIGWMNFSGCILILLNLWEEGNDLAIAIDMLSDWTNWMVVYLCAMVGWCVHLIVPPFVESYLELTYQIKLKNHYKKKRGLEKEWGEEVAKTSDLVTLQDMEEAYEALLKKEKTQLKRMQNITEDDEDEEEKFATP